MLSLTPQGSGGGARDTHNSVTLFRFRRHAPHELSARMSGGGLVLEDDLVTPSPVVHMWDRMHAPIHGRQSSDVPERATASDGNRMTA